MRWFGRGTCEVVSGTVEFVVDCMTLVASFVVGSETGGWWSDDCGCDDCSGLDENASFGIMTVGRLLAFKSLLIMVANKWGLFRAYLAAIAIRIFTCAEASEDGCDIGVVG